MSETRTALTAVLNDVTEIQTQYQGVINDISNFSVPAETVRSNVRNRIAALQNAQNKLAQDLPKLRDKFT
jgi:conjugal transfer/entry exclusion protein